MAKRQYFLIVDTETTQTNMVADFGAIICDRKGRVYATAPILVRDYFLDVENHPLFHTKGTADPLWGKANLPARYATYNDMLKNGARQLASVNAVNNWLVKARLTFKPILTAYNIAFDAGKCANSGIDLSIFEDRFCLWHSAASRWGHSKAFRSMVLETGALNKITPFGNWSYQTNAEIMARFVTGNPSLPNEPHTAYEDALLYEMPILQALVKDTPKGDYMNPKAYSWRDYQVKDYFQPK
jgi:hypothetical protein